MVVLVLVLVLVCILELSEALALPHPRPRPGRDRDAADHQQVHSRHRPLPPLSATFVGPFPVVAAATGRQSKRLPPFPHPLGGTSFPRGFACICMRKTNPQINSNSIQSFVRLCIATCLRVSDLGTAPKRTPCAAAAGESTALFWRSARRGAPAFGVCRG